MGVSAESVMPQKRRPPLSFAGDANTFEQFLKQETDEQGLLREVSVQSASGGTVEELS